MYQVLHEQIFVHDCPKSYDRQIDAPLEARIYDELAPAKAKLGVPGTAVVSNQGKGEPRAGL